MTGITDKKLLLLLLLVLFGLTGCTDIEGTGIEAKEAQLKSSIYNIQVSIERYYVDKGTSYPPDIQTLIDEGYFINGIMLNPFTGMPMEDIEYLSENPAGNFTYIPVEIDGEIKGYYLVGYGSNESDGMMLIGNNMADNAIIVVNSIIEGVNDSSLPPLGQLLANSITEIKD